MDEVGVIFGMNKCLLNVWEAMKGDVYMHFAVIQLTPLVQLINWVTGYMWSNPCYINDSTVYIYLFISGAVNI